MLFRSLTLLGPSGLLREQAGRLRPCPAFYALQSLKEGQSWHANDSLKDLGVVCLTRRDPAATTLVLLANLGTQEVAVPPEAIGPSKDAPDSRVELIDAAAWRAFEVGSSSSPWRSVGAHGAPLRLPPLAVAKLRR